MSSSRRVSKGRSDDGEFFLECKAAYLSVYDDVGDRIESKKDLLTVLQQSGRNPSNRVLDKYWGRNRDLSFQDFVDICKKEPATTADDLLKAFTKIDINGDGFISEDELYKIMNSKGDRMSREEVRRMIAEVDENNDRRLDYGEFCNMIMKTTNECKKMSMKVMEKKERKKKGKSSIRPSDISGGKQEKLKEESPRHSSHHQHNQNHHSHSVKQEKLREESPRHSTHHQHHQNHHSHSSKHSDGKKQPQVEKSREPSTKSKDASPRHESEHHHVMFKLNLETPRDADQIEEDIQVNDDLDIISPGRPTPKIDLKASPRKDSFENKHKKSMESDAKSSSKTQKGKSHSTDADALHALQNGEGKSQNLKSNIGTKDQSQSDVRIIITEDFVDNVKPVYKDEEKSKRRNVTTSEKNVVKETNKKLHGDEGDSSARLIDEIFKTTTRSNKDVKLDMYDMNKNEEKLSAECRNSASDTKPPRPKERTHTHATTPRPGITNHHTKEELTVGYGERGIKQDQREEPMIKSSEHKQKENGFGSQSSLRSGDIGAPVPSPRKAVSRMSEDEVPKPSPRIRPRDQKPKSSSRTKLPDSRTLRDWSMQTSKGSFFYEDDEIVTHVYSLRLTEESAVYFTAYPIQEPASLALPSSEPVDTALYILDSRGKLVTFTEQTDMKGRYGVKCDLSPGEYQIIPYTTGCRFKQRTPNDHVREAKLVKKDKEDNIAITSAFKKALEDIFDLCDLDDNGTMSRDEFNWFNLRTSGEELVEDEWTVVEEQTSLENGEITKRGFIELNEMEAKDSQGDVDDLWITLTSMGLNKALIMDEACPYRVEVYVERTGRREPKFKCSGIESLQKKELVQEICQSVIEKSQSEPVKIRNMKDLYMHTYKNDQRATVALENRSRSRVNVEVDCNRSKNVVSHRDSLDHNVEVDPQSMVIAHHLVPAREGADWTVICTETIHK